MAKKVEVHLLDPIRLHQRDLELLVRSSATGRDVCWSSHSPLNLLSYLARYQPSLSLTAKTELDSMHDGGDSKRPTLSPPHFTFTWPRAAEK